MNAAMPDRAAAAAMHRNEPRAVRAGRFCPLLWLSAVFLVVATLTRLALLVATHDGVPATPATWLHIAMTGLGYDLLTLCYVATPLVLWLALLPLRWLRSRAGRVVLAAGCVGLLTVIFFVALAEWTFWEEFQTRFNFIAVDYLVYTTEVIGNIRESYPLGLLLPALAACVAAVAFATRRWRRIDDDNFTWRTRAAMLLGWAMLCIGGTLFVDASMKDTTGNQYVDELAGNGIYQFFAAFRSAELDYDRFYATLPDNEAFAELRAQLATGNATFVDDTPTGIARRIDSAAPERRYNVVLISVESLSAEYSGLFGRSPSLTPELDRLAGDSLLFTNLYASGTRTVRGLEALALSVPPTPGESIVKRPHNENLHSLADVFNTHGYTSEFLYGGYGAFDNMTYFFSHNGYRVLDRAAIAPDAIHHANIWGVADEDLYTLALDELDRAAAAGTPLFAHVMTTSNHRPYTFPAGRIDAPQGERNSAVRYTDWAVTDFLRRARTRPWFDNTIFVITADHCAASGGIAQLPAFRYRIPMWIHAPGIVAPGRVDTMVAQIDIGPTILGLLGIDYVSEFYGVDALQTPPPPQRALIGNYQRLGYLRDGQLVQLSPHTDVRTLQPADTYNGAQPALPRNPALERQAIAYYQTASIRFRNGAMRHAVEPH